MAGPGGGSGIGITLAIVFWLLVIVALPAIYVLVGFDGLAEYWRIFIEN